MTVQFLDRKDSREINRELCKLWNSTSVLTSLCLVEWALIKLVTTIVLESNSYRCNTEKGRVEGQEAWYNEERVQMEAKGYKFPFWFCPLPALWPWACAQILEGCFPLFLIKTQTFSSSKSRLPVGNRRCLYQWTRKPLRLLTVVIPNKTKNNLGSRRGKLSKWIAWVSS